MSEKEEYCIWHAWLGQMDTSTDWEKLYKLVRKYDGYYNHSKLHIIPTRFVGKDKYRTIKEIQEDTDRMYYEAMRR